MIRVLCVVFDCYDTVERAVLFFIVTMLFSTLCVVFDCYELLLRAVCSF